MRFVAVSDTHLSEPELPEGDVLLHAGDLTYNGTVPEVSKAARWLGEQTKRYKHVVVIAGNHDWLFQKDRTLAQRIMQDSHLTYLEDKAITICPDGSQLIGTGFYPESSGITIYGSPWQPNFNNWAFNLPRGNPLKEKWDMIPKGIDILMTHGPPYNILDGVGQDNEDVYPEDDSLSIEHVGCYDLREAVNKVKPKFHIFGHVHASYGLINYEGTTFINASIMNEAYDPEHKPWVFELP